MPVHAEHGLERRRQPRPTTRRPRPSASSRSCAALATRPDCRSADADAARPRWGRRRAASRARRPTHARTPTDERPPWRRSTRRSAAGFPAPPERASPPALRSPPRSAGRGPSEATAESQNPPSPAKTRPPPDTGIRHPRIGCPTAGRWPPIASQSIRFARRFAGSGRTARFRRSPGVVVLLVQTRIVASLGSVLADVAQLVELSVVVRAVAGSSPVIRPSRPGGTVG